MSTMGRTIYALSGAGGDPRLDRRSGDEQDGPPSARVWGPGPRRSYSGERSTAERGNAAGRGLREGGKAVGGGRPAMRTGAAGVWARSIRRGGLWTPPGDHGGARRHPAGIDILPTLRPRVTRGGSGASLPAPSAAQARPERAPRFPGLASSPFDRRRTAPSRVLADPDLRAAGSRCLGSGSSRRRCTAARSARRRAAGRACRRPARRSARR